REVSHADLLMGLDPDQVLDLKAAAAKEVAKLSMRPFAALAALPQFYRRPGAARGRVVGKPRVAAVLRGKGRADQNRAIAGDQPLERRKRAVPLHPVQRAADRHDVEAADVVAKRLDLAFDQREVSPSAGCGKLRGGEHLKLGVDADNASDIGREAKR